MNNSTSAKILKSSVSPLGYRFTTFLVKFPRFIEAEILRHRAFSFSAASSRAINLAKHINNVEQDVFVPIFTEDCTGMSAKKLHDNQTQLSDFWLGAFDTTLYYVKKLLEFGVHKQHASRLLQPFEYQTMIVSATEWTNFFDLRCPKYLFKGEYYKSKKDLIKVNQLSEDEINSSEFWFHINTSHAQPEIQELAELMWDAYNENIPDKLEEGQWHLPFGEIATQSIEDNIAMNVARCARVSYLSDIEDVKKNLSLFDKLKDQAHWSPFEHIAVCMSEEDHNMFHTTTPTRTIDYTCNNVRGFIPLRFIMENNYNKFNIFNEI